jgi:hypothetical protein
MLECVPPRDQRRDRFAVGEPYADRHQFGGTFDDDQQHAPVYACYFVAKGNDNDENATYLTGFFTIRDYLRVKHSELIAAAE